MRKLNLKVGDQHARKKEKTRSPKSGLGFIVSSALPLFAHEKQQ